MCDTFVALPSVTADQSVIFGKNSDREPNEAQVLEYHPGSEHKKGENVQCTYLSIPQVSQTSAILISRPFWMWGAEIGANEHGVVIGNEAVWTKMPIERVPGLTGMDILRLALERGRDAASAMEVMIQLLHDHGQGGICGYEDKKMAYHNSYIIADSRGAWIFETAGSFWAARQVHDYYSISNTLTIGEEIDRMHPGLIDHAKKKGWLKKGQQFSFSTCYSDWFYTTFSAARKRQNQSWCKIRDNQQNFGLKDAFSLLRNHGDSAYAPDSHLLGNRICAHAGNYFTRNATQSTASMVAHLKGDDHTFWATASSAPCTGIFKPVWIGDGILPGINPDITGRYNEKSYWWFHEKLHRQVIRDYSTRNAVIIKERNKLEDELIAKADKIELNQKNEFCHHVFSDARRLTFDWIKRLESMPVGKKAGLFYNRYWKYQNRKAGLEL